MKLVDIKMTLRVAAISLPVFGLGVMTSSANSVKDTQNVLAEWIKVEKQISEDQAEWLVQQEIMANSITFMKGEFGRLEETIKEAEASASAGERKRAELEAEKAKLDAVMEDMTATIGNYEDKIRQLSRQWPEIFLKQVETPMKRMPSGDQVATAALTMRLQNVVIILSQFDKFQSIISKDTGIQEVEGVSREVSTLYYGLAYAYFIDASGQYAGYGHPGQEGWEWTVVPQLGPKITQLLSVYDRNIDASFIGLPAKIVTR
jgi:hypothetical protein